jgi:TPR repeat protein
MAEAFQPLISKTASLLPLAVMLALLPGCALLGGKKTAARYLREGNRYYSGQWVARDLDRAMENYRKAAALGDPDAYYKLGQCYDSGIGVPKNDAESATWYEKAAKLGNAEAEYALGLDYELGRGVPKNDILAYAWLNIAASSGHEKARARRDSLGMRMPAGSVTKAQKLSLQVER